MMCQSCQVKAYDGCSDAELLSAGWRWSAMVRGWLCRLCARATRDIRGDKTTSLRNVS